jgi:hypothetical protein
VLVGRDRIGVWTGGVRALAEHITRRVVPRAAPQAYPAPLAEEGREGLPEKGR